MQEERKVAENKLMVLCANLRKRKDRRFVMSLTMPHVLGESLQFIDSIDGCLVPQWKMARYHVEANPADYAVRLTKRIAIRKFLQSQCKFLLYLEDDVVVTEDFEQEIETAMERDKEICFLGDEEQLPHTAKRYVHRTKPGHHAILMTREGAKKTLRLLGKWKHARSHDELSRQVLEGTIKAWYADPPVAYQRLSVSDTSGRQRGVNLSEDFPLLMGGDEVALLDAAMNVCKTVVEYGSGASTLFLAEKLKDWGSLLSIEHDGLWFEKVGKVLEIGEYPVTRLLCEPKPLRSSDGPLRYLPGQLNHYVDAPHEQLALESVDLAFINGRERIRCALTMVPLMKTGALLMIHDFWSRKRYRDRLPDLLEHYDYFFETPGNGSNDPRGMAVFIRQANEGGKNENETIF